MRPPAVWPTSPDLLAQARIARTAIRLLTRSAIGRRSGFSAEIFFVHRYRLTAGLHDVGVRLNGRRRATWAAGMFGSDGAGMAAARRGTAGVTVTPIRLNAVPPGDQRAA